jgi:hypothetical protein
VAAAVLEPVSLEDESSPPQAARTTTERIAANAAIR